MAEQFKFVIVGGGLAGASAVEGIRELNQIDSILVIGGEKHLPYNRPPLTKQLWTGKKKVEEIFVHDQKYYDEKRARLIQGRRVVKIDRSQRTVTDDQGKVFGYEKLLLATGGIPNTLPITGGNLEGIYYYRYLDDYLRLRPEAGEGKSAVVIGGGFIGSEIAAALSMNKVDVTMIFPSPYICSNVFSDDLGKALQQQYVDRGIRVMSGQKPASLGRAGARFVTRTEAGQPIESDLVIAGVGIRPDTGLAGAAGLNTGNGIEANEYLETSDPAIYVAGDIALFPYTALGKPMRVEHWDNAVNQGKWAGRNMAGAGRKYDYMPYFYSDLFEFGYEAVGEVDSRLEIFADWKKENSEGMIYYLRDGRIRGVMACNMWDRMDAARELIRKGDRMTPESLRGLIG